MYMITRGNSMIPLIKLSEGYSFGLKQNYVTVVCGSNGERLRPIKVWDEPFVFFSKEKLNAEFISKTELIYIKVSDVEQSSSMIIDIIKYRLPEYMIDNIELEYDVIRKTKPITETMMHIELSKDSPLEILDDFIDSVANGAFKDAVVQAINKLDNKDKLCYVLG